MFTLFNIIFSIAAGILGLIIGGENLLSFLYSLAVFLPSLAVLVRRLHDTGKSGWWILIGLIPLIGAIVLLVFTILEGEQGDNQYGSDPKAFG